MSILPGLKIPLELIQPVVVAPDTPISECLDEMRNNKSSAAIVCGPAGEFLGIFTERDYFQKGHVIEKLITAGRQPLVSLCMDKTVRPLPASRVHLAHKYMLRTGRRYIPISDPNASAAEYILGVLSMDELLRYYLDGAAPDRTASPGIITSTFGLISTDHAMAGNFLSLHAQIYEKRKLLVRPVDASELVGERQITLIGRSFDAILLDIRTFEPKKWSRMIITWLRDGGPQRIAILSAPERVTGAPKTLIDKMIEDNRFHFYTRPKSQLEASKLMLSFLKTFPLTRSTNSTDKK